MNIENFQIYYRMVYDWWQSLPFEYRYYAWAVGGLLLFLLWFVAARWLVRRLRGHMQFRGTWFTRQQMQELVNMLSEDQSSGRRVMQHDEVELLRRWKYGKQKVSLGFDRPGTGY